MKHAILISGAITKKSLGRVIDEIEFYKKTGDEYDKFIFVINSDGGHAKVALEFIEKIKQMNIHILAKIYKAGSAAALIALSAEEREIVKDGTFAIHLGSVTIESSELTLEGKVSDRVMLEAQNLRKVTFSLMSRCGINENGPHMSKLIAQNMVELNPEECLKIGLVQRII